MTDIDENLIRKIVREVLAQTQTDQTIDFQKNNTQNNGSASSKSGAVSEKALDWFQPVGLAKPGYSKDEIVIAVAPAYATVLTKTESSVTHQEALRQMIAGIEEEGLKARVVKVYDTSDVSFMAVEADSLSGSGISIGIQSKGTVIIHQKDQEALNNLELFPEAPVVDEKMFRAIGKNAAHYAKGDSPEPVSQPNDQMARPNFQAISAILHIRETHQVVSGKPAEEIKVTF
ncbi:MULTISPECIES: propanediol/glycerol family dehydratase medium subunit [Lactobacillaceae]|uniref:propanediol/glycerol family dehydratase medium subunit n=1 Tax=Lactobacillaceae TaxID=33958 RepID=UPI0014575D9E|nr:propanediol/glycerol family dehydratase medium subunit [Lactobacillus sp. HBUAS51381]NLR09003.1 propanediol/glycerol family dehydratase medium subunit [Lactobacillus sp. HBUAS51381]